MSTQIGPKCRLCRREGEKLFLKGERCYTSKCALVVKNYIPGAHGQKGAGQLSEYGKQLREKQKMKRIYGVTEEQFRKYFQEAEKKGGVTGDMLLQKLEQRLDNTVYKLGIAPSRRSARQLVNHGCIAVNSKNVTIPSYCVRTGDRIAIKDEKRQKKIFEHIAERLKDVTSPSWLHLDVDKLEGKVLKEPTREDADHTVDTQLIVEHYSR